MVKTNKADTKINYENKLLFHSYILWKFRIGKNTFLLHKANHYSFQKRLENYSFYICVSQTKIKHPLNALQIDLFSAINLTKNQFQFFSSSFIHFLFSFLWGLLFSRMAIHLFVVFIMISRSDFFLSCSIKLAFTSSEYSSIYALSE